MASGDRFKDKVAIVTGGCCGIGRGCVDVFADHGGKVAVLDVNDEEGAKIANDNVYFIHCDMNSEDEIKKAIEKVVEKYKKIDCLVNNAGKHPGNKSIDELSVDSFRDLLNLNLVSYFAACKYALPYLRKTSGSIVNITSISGHSGTANSPSYCATKGGGISLTKALAIDEAKYGVRVNAISPSAVNTPLYRKVISSSGEAEKTNEIVESYTLLNRVSEPREMGMACLFLAVDATYTTGAELMCTAGSEIGYGVKGMSFV
ncbi:17-beta-hydroxysteroid dehydrogenase 14-like [Ruditapes philippinarum]|uniref:17-beta-hydroxysteroid dehydrogenase 14-like n=1 Tax=Ruditapes philippinarum TaxID=129788 RepID=UPI00295B1F4D|nr:17-beta-hydroxysteroid dehydrogenase 14-like [Ruditapes philippinarum]